MPPARGQAGQDIGAGRHGLGGQGFLLKRGGHLRRHHPRQKALQRYLKNLALPGEHGDDRPRRAFLLIFRGMRTPDAYNEQRQSGG